MVIPEYLACALNKLISLNSNEQIVNSTLHGELQEKQNQYVNTLQNTQLQIIYLNWQLKVKIFY